MIDYESRLQAIEDAINTLQTALNNLATKAEMISYLGIRQNEIENISTKITSLKSQVELLQAVYYYGE